MTSTLILGCQGCDANRTSSHGFSSASPPTDASALLPVPPALVFDRARRPNEFAAPEHCALRAPIVIAPMTSADARVFAESHTLATLLVGEATGTPPALARAGAMLLDPTGPSRAAAPVAWFETEEPPRLAVDADAKVLAAVNRAGDNAPPRIAIGRGAHIEDLIDTAGLRASAIACDHGDCAMLTSRRADEPGAEVWFGRADGASRSWTSVAIEPTRQGAMSDARAFTIGRIDGARETVDAGASVNTVAVLAELGELVFFAVDRRGSREFARLPAKHAAIDAIATRSPLAMVHDSDVNDEGCSPVGGSIALVRASLPAAHLHVAAPPTKGFLRPLVRGYCAGLIAPLGCGKSRSVAYGVVLDDDGTPTSALMPIGDATSYAVAASGPDVDVWLTNDASLTWLRLRCEAP